MVILEKIKKTYAGKKNFTVALNDVSLMLPDKGLIFIVGKSGCGKTTLLNILGGLDTFDSGRMICQGVDTSRFLDKDWDKYRNSYVGFVFQENNLLEEYNVFDNIQIATDFQNVQNSEDRIISSLKFVGLEDYASRKIGELSGGQKQRVAIARALAKNSKLLLADEPTGSLDSAMGREIFDLLKELSKNQLVVVVTHDLSSAQEYGDQIIEMTDGQVVDVAKHGEIVEDANRTFETEKSVLKPKMCMRLSTKAFKKTPIRLIVLILLSMFGFSLMIGALKFATWQPYDLQHKVLAREKEVVLSLSPEVIDLGGGQMREEVKHFTVQQFEEFAEKYDGANVVGVADYVEEYNNQGLFGQLTDRQRLYFNEHFNGIAFLSENDFKAYGFELLAGSFPNDSWGEYDVAVSEYLYEIYTLTGFTYNGLEEIKINSYNDLIGKQFGGMYGNKYTIRGVINTFFDKAEFENIKKYALGYSDDYSLEWSKEFNVYAQKGFHNLMFRSPKYKGSLNDYSYIIMKYYQDVFNKTDLIYKVFHDDEYVFCDYYSQILKYQSTQTQRVGGIMLGISIVTILFAVVLFANFIAVSIQDKSRQIGILRAIGATKRQISAIFIVQNTIIAVVVFVLSCILVKFAIMPILLLLGTTTEFPFPWYELKVVDYFILLGTIVITSILASLVPLIKLSKKTPRELMTK